MTDRKGKPTYVFMTNGYSEILEYSKRDDAEKFVVLLNTNSDSGWEYEVLSFGS